MARKQASQGTPATAALAAAGVPFVLHPYAHDPSAASYGMEAAEVLGMDPARVFKTLMVEVDGRLAVGVVPVSGNLDLKAIAAALGGKKAAMADPATAQRRTGYVLGGISPLGQRQPSPTVLDESALGLDTHPGLRRPARPGHRTGPGPTWSGSPAPSRPASAPRRKLLRHRQTAGPAVVPEASAAGRRSGVIAARRERWPGLARGASCRRSHARDQAFPALRIDVPFLGVPGVRGRSRR